MAKVFDFNDYNLDLIIAGKKFHVNCNSDIGDKMQKLSKDGQPLIEQVRSGEKTSEDALQYLADALDGILGEGAFEKIFENRKPNVTDCADVLIFLSGEIAAAHKEQKEKNMNREQRRAAAKSK